MESESFEDISYEAPNLDIPAPPDDLPYSLLEDYRYREILKANGISLAEESLVSALQSRTDILQAAVAHTIGSNGVRAAVSVLKGLLATSDDLVRVESAFALARLGEEEGHKALVQCLDYPLEGYLCPPIAAGYLAQMNDPQGFQTIERCFAVEIDPVKMLACKQLFFFMRFHGTQDRTGNDIDVLALFERALTDPDTNIQWQALVQMRQLDAAMFRSILDSYVRATTDEHLRKVASDILNRS